MGLPGAGSIKRNTTGDGALRRWIYKIAAYRRQGSEELDLSNNIPTRDRALRSWIYQIAALQETVLSGAGSIKKHPYTFL